MHNRGLHNDRDNRPPHRGNHRILLVLLLQDWFGSFESGDGHVIKAAGDIEAARSAYQEVHTREPGFADVESRLTELEARIAKEEPESEPEVELRAPDTAEYEAFDGFLDDLDEPAVCS